MTARPARRSLVLLATAGLTAGLVPALSTTAMAVTATETETVAEGLDNPRGMAYVAGDADSPDLLFIAENGTGGDAPCAQAGDPEDPNDPSTAPQVCYGATGAITMVDLDTGDQRRVVTGLPSIALKGGGGNEATGPADVSVVPGSYDGSTASLRIVIGLGAPPTEREKLGAGGADLGTLVGVDVDTTPTGQPADADDWEVLADIAGFEQENDPVKSTNPETGEEGPPESNPHAVLALGDETLVVDAGGNTLVSVDESAPLAPLPLGEPSYEVTLAEAFESERTAPAPAFLGAPPGTMIPYESVPTTVARVTDGDDEGTDPDLLVGELTGFPFPVGEANLYEVDLDPATDPEVHESGFTTVADIAERDLISTNTEPGDLFVAEFGHTGLLTEAPVGAVVRDRGEGGRQALLTRDLSFPGGVVVDSEELVYVTNGGIEADTGTVLVFDPSVAGDPALQAACDPDEVVWPTFDDIEPSVHEEAIACLAWWDVLRGIDADSFGPAQKISRAQTASVLARLLDSTDEPAPATSTNAFDDDNGSTHEANINRLAAAGVVRGKTDRRYAPTLDVTRGELATLAVRTYERVTGAALPSGANAFTDDNTSVHQSAIDKAAAQGWVGGYGNGRFGPGDPVTRAQSATLLARMLSDLAEDGRATRSQA